MNNKGSIIFSEELGESFNISLLSNTDVDFPGLDGKVFDLCFKNPDLKPDDIIVPVKNKRLSIKIVSEATNVLTEYGHSSWFYNYGCKLLTDDSNEFFPKEYAEMDEPFIKIGSLIPVTI